MSNKKKLPLGYNPEPFPPGYTQADEDRHLRAMRNIHLAGIISKVVLIGSILGGIVVGVAHHKPVVKTTIKQQPIINKE